MDSSKRLPLIIGAAVLLILIVVVGLIKVSYSVKGDKEVVLEENTESIAVETRAPLESYYVPEDDLFTYVSVEEYKEDVDKLLKVVNCQYLGEYDFTDVLSNIQEEYIKVELSKEFPQNKEYTDITPAMSVIYKAVKNTILNESIDAFPSHEFEEDVWVSPDDVVDNLSESYVEETTVAVDVSLSYPVEYYDCMLDENGYLLYELDESVLISTILMNNIGMSYDDGRWYISKSSSIGNVINILGHTIDVNNVMNQMCGVEEYKFKIDNLRVYDEKYFILSIYRGKHYFNLKVEKQEDKYIILNINGFIDVLKEIVL